MSEGRLVHVADRQQGKTKGLIAWLQEGHQIDAYPGWSRIVVTPTEHEAQYLRKQHGLDYHQVYSFTDWSRRYRHGFARGLEIAIDNADTILQRLVGDQELAYVTFTGTPAAQAGAGERSA